MSGLRIPDFTGNEDTPTAALMYAEAGWYIGPLKIGTKHPGSFLGDDWDQKTSRNPDVITAWFKDRDDLGVFLHVGRSGGWVADVDKPDKLPDVLKRSMAGVPFQATRPTTDPARGHYVFTAPPGRRLGNSTGKLGSSWGEARGRNGVIVAWPTPHPGRGRYQWRYTGPCPVLQAEIADLLPDAGETNDAVTDVELTAFLTGHTRADRPELLKAVTNALTTTVAEGKSRHEAARDCACWAMREAACGLYPALEAATALRDVYIETRKNDRTGGRAGVGEQTARDEFRSICAWAIGQVDGENLQELRAKINARAPDNYSLIGDINTNGDSSAPASPTPLTDCVATFQRWLYLPDPGIVIATIAATAANLLAGDPCWLLLVGPPSSAKTECVSALVPLPYVHPAAKVTETALLSGTPPKERVKGSRGGLMRQVGDFGILLLKDFTSVLAQNRDTRAEALAALREIYDGRWDRPVGTGGGITLSWSGKCGLVGGCTPTIDRHHAVMGTLGERFLFYRVNVEDPDDQASRRLTSRRHEPDMRRELAAAVAGVLAGVDADADITADPDEDRWLVSLAVFTAKARTPVERDGYSHEVVVMPESEGPARIVTQLGAMRDGLIAIGATVEQRWAILHKLAWDAMPAMRRQVFAALEEADGWSKKAELMDATDIPEAPLRRELEDLVLVGLVDRSKDGEHDNSPWQHRLSAQAHALWPKACPRSTPPHGYDDSDTFFKEKSVGGGTNRTGTEAAPTDDPDPDLVAALDQLDGKLGPLEWVDGDDELDDAFDIVRGDPGQSTNPGELGPLNREELF